MKSFVKKLSKEQVVAIVQNIFGNRFVLKSTGEEHFFVGEKELETVGYIDSTSKDENSKFWALYIKEQDCLSVKLSDINSNKVIELKLYNTHFEIPKSQENVYDIKKSTYIHEMFKMFGSKYYRLYGGNILLPEDEITI